MANHKPFPPTARKLCKARDDGDVAKSSELSSFLGFCCGVAVFVFGVGQRSYSVLNELFVKVLSQSRDINVPDVIAFLEDSYWVVAAILAEVLIPVFLSVFLVEGLQTGFRITPKAFSLRWSRLNPAQGFLRIFGLLGPQEGGEGMLGKVLQFLRLTLLLALGITVVGQCLFDSIRILGRARFGEGTEGLLVERFMIFLALLCAGGIALGLGDLFWRRLLQRMRLGMDVEELKREYQEEEGSAEMKALRKQLHRQYALHALVDRVRKARVVVAKKIN